MEIKFTKGEWEHINHLASDQTHEVNKVMCGTISICVIRTNNKEQAEANAKLIALSPIMFEYIAKKADGGCEEAKKIVSTLC